MTRAARDRILKEANGNISDHLRNHIHLTNCIHLKNHMHKHSPIISDRALVKDLLVLRRSQSLRDPSASPPSWHSTSVVDMLSKRMDNDNMIREGRRSVGSDRRREGRRLSASSPLVASQSSSKVAPDEENIRVNGVADIIDHYSKIGGQRIVKRDGSRRLQQSRDGNEQECEEIVSRLSGTKAAKSRQKGIQSVDARVKTLSEQLNDIAVDSDGAACSHFRFRGQREKANEELQSRHHGPSGGLNRAKRRKFRAGRRSRAAASVSKHSGPQNEMFVASNSAGQGLGHPKYYTEEGKEENEDRNLRDPGNGCGIPWNWSRIHHRGKTFLDMAGRSLSCGLSDPRLKKDGEVPLESGIFGRHVLSDHSSSSTRSNNEALPLLVEAYGSQKSAENATWVHDYSGELGIFADNLLKHDIDLNLASEGKPADQRKSRGHNRQFRHQNLTQKYMPRTFRDLVGQNLVAQALSNAIVKRKIGLMYLFYGPHGTGKTSCARIFARALNCQSLEQPKPCGGCNSCIAHDMGKSRNITEVGPVSNFGIEIIMDLQDNMFTSQASPHYRVCIFDDCETLTPERWSAISKVIDRAPRRLVFVLVSSSLDALPHIIISRCQKFFFPKLKEADIIYSLQWIACKEGLEIDKDALKLIASRSDGSLRDAEMTLEQLSLLGQRISVPLVQELVGLISDEKLVDLLDFALSANTVNTVKNLREIMENGVEPLALMSQLATMITDILAGSYDFTKERPRRKFFRRQPLHKEDMEKLRQALKTLSEAEKQLRLSNDKLTWLTAALLQLAPHQQYMLPASSADTSFNHSPLVLNHGVGRLVRRGTVQDAEIPNHEKGLPSKLKVDNLHTGTSLGVSGDNRIKDNITSGSGRKEIDEIWLEVLEKVQYNSIREFMYQEGKLISISFGAGPIIQLMFRSQLAKSKAERFSGYILQAFESVLGSPVVIEISYDSGKGLRNRGDVPLILLPSKENVVHGGASEPTQTHLLRDDYAEALKSEIVEILSPSREPKTNQQVQGSSYPEEPSFSHKRSTMVSPLQRRRKTGEQQPSQSIVRSKVSLAHVIQQTEGCSQRSWSKRKAVSIAEKLEQENLRLEARSRSLLCWKGSRVPRPKPSRLRIRTLRSRSLLKLVSCGRCLSSKSPR